MTDRLAYSAATQSRINRVQGPARPAAIHMKEMMSLARVLSNLLQRCCVCQTMLGNNRQRTKLYPLVIAGMLGLLAMNAGAESAYVTDQGEFNMRSGESTQHKIIRMLASGTEVEVIGKNAETGYSRIRLNDGTIGFILSRYLQNDPAARELLAEMRGRLDALQQEPDQIAALFSRLEKDHDVLMREYQVASERNLILEEELAELQYTSSNIVRINEERNQLQEDVANLTRTVGQLKQQNLSIRSGDNWQWFLTGGGVAGAGLLAGLILGGFKHRRGGSRRLF